MSLGVVSGIGTLVLLLAFIGLCVWAYSPRQRRRWDESAKLPFLDDDDEDRTAKREGGARHD